MNILFSHFGIYHGMGFSRSFMLAKNLAKTDNTSVHFYTSQATGFTFPWKVFKEENVLVASFPDIVPKKVSRLGFGVIAPILKIIFSLKYSYKIVHSDSGHRPNSGLVCIYNKLFRKSIYIAEWWDDFGINGIFKVRPLHQKLTIGIFDIIFEKLDKRFANGIVCLSEYTKSRAKQLGKREENLTIIHGGADIDSIKFLKTENTLRQQLDIPADAVVFLYIGMSRDEYYDNFNFINSLLKDDSTNNYLILTGGYNLKENLSIESPRIIELGWLPYEKFSEMLSVADFCLLLQRKNNLSLARYPNKLGDYFSIGRSIITNPYGETTKILDRYPDFFIKCEDTEQAISHILGNSKKYKKCHFKYRESIRDFAEKDYSWHAKSEELYAFYNSFF